MVMTACSKSPHDVLVIRSTGEDEMRKERERERERERREERESLHHLSPITVLKNIIHCLIPFAPLFLCPSRLLFLTFRIRIRIIFIGQVHFHIQGIFSGFSCSQCTWPINMILILILIYVEVCLINHEYG